MTWCVKSGRSVVSATEYAAEIRLVSLRTGEFFRTMRSPSKG